MAVFGFCNNKCKHEVYTADEVYKKSEVYSKSEVYPKSDVYKKTEVYSKTEIDSKIPGNYSRGTSAPSGGSNGDIYDQYF